MHQRLDPILDILDEGLRIYRRGFVGFALIAALGLVPVAIVAGLVIGEQVAFGSDLWLFLNLAFMVISLGLSMYLFAAMSRATIAVQQGQGVRLREALAIHPLRVAGIGCFGMIFLLVANASAMAFSCICIFPAWCALVFGFSSAAAGIGGFGALGAGAALFLGALLVLLIILVYALTLVLFGAAYGSTIYGLQALVQDEIPLGEAVGRSVDLLFYRLGRNLLTFFFASAIFSALSVSVSLAVGTLLPLPLLIALGAESPLVQGVSASAWLLGLIVVLPPMPIWMALLYQRNRAARDGADLDARIGRV